MLGDKGEDGKNCYFCGMKKDNITYENKRRRSKGERLKWASLKEAKRVRLRLFVCVGEEVTQEELEKLNHDKRSILVP